eukprot:TRINITY_DN6062_c0_g1_i3.p1 TRINITY_DN6062_c0_g1~~TRINITY_DN6062_c0_g1_i3.p1  ORF type:complete len:242 (+),score=-26.04 TRINITY_DN6062_c0_g1_i3:52-726(+)
MGNNWGQNYDKEKNKKRIYNKYLLNKCFQLLEKFFWQARWMIKPKILIYFIFCKTLPVIVFLFLISIILIQILIYHVSFPTNMITTKYLFQSFLQFCKLITIFDIVSFNSQSKITNFDLKVINSIIKQYLFIEQIDFLNHLQLFFHGKLQFSYLHRNVRFFFICTQMINSSQFIDSTYIIIILYSCIREKVLILNIKFCGSLVSLCNQQQQYVRDHSFSLILFG